MFDFTADTGYFVEVSLTNHRVRNRMIWFASLIAWRLYLVRFPTINVQPCQVTHQATPSDPFFTGFLNFAYTEKGALDKEIKGITATVTESGYCDDGCIQYG